ncbi:hypothetical protein [Nonomuraea roseoviolacea]|uniref:Uncharacterized protein n=1 Tax=Nonomuraea roseoviolacea subsp. carminata TaxID=160689 RepID=A0ABT1KAE1_9ACTN|nr:hypothetical protein [Nonomuraea roseoviolacea]MCP2350574.1 hypothetical protein [Nonomuraea roseoviolacea subsp. carminata]
MRDDLPWELREEPDPPSEVVARWEDGRLVITVSASLQGLEREDAVDAILRHYRRRDWKGIFPIPLLVGAWEWTREHERAASAAAGTAATAIVGTIALAITGALDPEERRPYAAPPPTTIVMTVDGTRTELSATARPSTPRASRRPTAPPAVAEPRRPAATPPTAGPSRRSTTEATRPARRTPPPSARPTRKRPEPSATAREPRRERETVVAVTAPPRRSERPTVDARPAATTAPAPQPGPTVAAAGCDGLVHARVDPLLDVCVRLR